LTSPGEWEASSLLVMTLTQAIVDAAEARQRAAVLLIGFEPDWSGISCAQDWAQTMDAVVQRIPNRRGDCRALRCGAAEIAVTLGKLGDSLAALVRANEILDALSRSDGVDGCGIAYRVAIGIGLFPEDGDAASRLLDRANEALADLRMMGLSAAGFSMRRTLRGSATSILPRLDPNATDLPARPRDCGGSD
jgi:predicted signal transduction protein with EAL and GGDEF domain